MAVDKNKITAEATKLVQKGQFDKAIRTYERILAEDAKDVRVLLKVGELYQKKGDNAAAAETFNKVADAYGEQGFFLKAVAVYKQIIKLTPDDARVNERLAGLYQQLGLMSDAMAQLQIVAGAYERAGDGVRLLDVLRRMVELDPENIASSIKLGELYAKAGKGDAALELFRRAAGELKSNNRIDEYLKVSERIAFLAPNDLGLTRELANIYLAKGDTKRALAKLQTCFKAEPKDIETLTLLAQAFRDLGQTSKTVSVFKELARVYEEKGRAEDARATFQRILELAPDDADATEALGRGAPAPPPRPAAAPRAPAPGRPPSAAARPPPVPPAPPAAAPARAAGPDAIPRLLTETDVYVKYGLHSKAIDHLAKVFAIDPDNPDAHEKMRDIHEAAGNKTSAVEAALKAARACVARGLADRTAGALDRLRALSPRHPELGLLAAAAGLPEPEAPAPAAEDDDLALAAAGQEGEEVVDDEARSGELGFAPAEIPQDAELEIVPDEEAAPPPARRAAPAPHAAPPPGGPAPARAPARAAVPDLSDEMEEADFYAQQGLLDEAREALRALLAAHPGHPAVTEKLAEMDRKAAPAPARRPPARPLARPPAPAPAEADESFDIARELAEELDGTTPPPSTAADEFQYSVEDVFNQFKKGVEKTVRPEDSETHYDLGIAYKEMGLLDDAIHEFEVALAGKTRKKEIDCLSMIGLCRGLKGEHAEAVQAFRRALRSDALTPEAGKAVHYELGLAHEALGEPEVALWYFQKICKVDARYRDAKAHVDRLGGGPGRPPADGEGARNAGRPPGAAPRSSERPAPAEKPGAKKNIGYV
jgi:tetratricopeptide (TPR) repeat protein